MTDSSPPLALMLGMIGRAIAPQFAQRLADLDLMPRHVALLQAASAQNTPSQAELAGRLGLVPSAVVPIVDELEARGAVRRTQDSSDRRRSIVAVTNEGRRLLAEAATRAQGLDRELLEQLPPDLAEAFSTATRLIAGQLGLGSHHPDDQLKDASSS
jgi:DNA-binding MarR family transcriptional regulator